MGAEQSWRMPEIFNASGKLQMPAAFRPRVIPTAGSVHKTTELGSGVSMSYLGPVEPGLIQIPGTKKSLSIPGKGPLQDANFRPAADGSSILALNPKEDGKPHTGALLSPCAHRPGRPWLNPLPVHGDYAPQILPLADGKILTLQEIQNRRDRQCPTILIGAISRLKGHHLIEEGQFRIPIDVNLIPLVPVEPRSGNKQTRRFADTCQLYIRGAALDEKNLMIVVGNPGDRRRGAILRGILEPRDVLSRFQELKPLWQSIDPDIHSAFSQQHRLLAVAHDKTCASVFSTADVAQAKCLAHLIFNEKTTDWAIASLHILPSQPIVVALLESKIGRGCALAYWRLPATPSAEPLVASHVTLDLNCLAHSLTLGTDDLLNVIMSAPPYHPSLPEGLHRFSVDLSPRPPKAVTREAVLLSGGWELDLKAPPQHRPVGPPPQYKHVLKERPTHMWWATGGVFFTDSSNQLEALDPKSGAAHELARLPSPGEVLLQGPMRSGDTFTRVTRDPSGTLEVSGHLIHRLSTNGGLYAQEIPLTPLPNQAHIFAAESSAQFNSLLIAGSDGLVAVPNPSRQSHLDGAPQPVVISYPDGEKLRWAVFPDSSGSVLGQTTEGQVVHYCPGPGSKGIPQLRTLLRTNLIAKGAITSHSGGYVALLFEEHVSVYWIGGNGRAFLHRGDVRIPPEQFSSIRLTNEGNIIAYGTYGPHGTPHEICKISPERPNEKHPIFRARDQLEQLAVSPDSSLVLLARPLDDGLGHPRTEVRLIPLV